MRYLFNLVHFPNGDYPGKVTQRDEKEIFERLYFLIKQQRAYRKMQKTIP